MNNPASVEKIDIADNEKDARAPRWDISQERQFIEQLLGQRFYFLLVFFSIFVAGAVNAKGVPFLQAAVLTVGAVIAFCLQAAIWRTHKKLEFFLSHLQNNHPAAVTERPEFKTGRNFIGKVVPRICFWALAAWALYSWLEWLFPSLPKLN